MPCLLPESIKDLRQAIMSDGGFAGLRGKTAQQRIDLFKQYVDNPGQQSTAEWLNREIERRILKPGQASAVKDWVKKLEKKKIKITNKQALIDRILAKKDVFNPKSFYAEGLVKQALGFEVSQERAKELFEKAKTVNAYKDRLLAVSPNYYNLTAEELRNLPDDVMAVRMELGKHLVEFKQLYEAINLEAQAQKYDTSGFFGRRAENLLKFAGNLKSMKASFDLSFFRQIQNVAYVHKDSFKDAMATGYKVFFGERGQVDTILAELLTRPNALSGRYNDFGIEVGIKEEAFPESWVSAMVDKGGLSRINAFARSEDAFGAAIQTARADLFDWMWERSKGDIKLLHDQKIGDAINTITGRGQFPLLVSKTDQQQNRIMNNLLFAPRWVASRIQTITDIRHIGQIGKMSPQGIRARAALGNIILLSVLMAAKGALWGLDDDDDRSFWEMLDPRSADFGKVIVGETRFDLTGGTAALFTLFSRLATQETRTSSGKVKAVKWSDVMGNWLAGKRSPGVQAIGQLRALATEGKFVDYRGKPLKWDTIQDFVENIGGAVLPISVANIVEVGYDWADPNISLEYVTAETAGAVADIIGIGTTTYK